MDSIAVASPDRLAVVAGYCCGPVVVEVGCDRGVLLSRLAGLHPDWCLHGIERSRRCLAVAAVPSSVHLHLGDGLQPVAGADLDCAVYAGLGEETIRRLLERDWSIAGGLRRLVICAASIDGRLRPWLNDRGWHCVAERLVQRGRRLHLVSACEPGRETEPDPVRRAQGPRLFAAGDPLLPQWQAFWTRRFATARLSGRVVRSGPLSGSASG